MVQWLRLHVSKAGGPGSIPRSHLPQLRPGTAKYIYVYIYIYICVYIYIYIFFFKEKDTGSKETVEDGDWPSAG